MIEAGAGTEYAIIGPGGEIEALYLGTYYVNGDDLEFIPNPQIPRHLLDFDIPISSNRLSPMLWLPLLLALLVLPFILFLLLRRKFTVTFYGDEDLEPFKQRYKKHERLSPPDVFEREGEVITGWYRDKLLTPEKKWSFTDDKVKRNTKLYAQWAEVK